MGRGLCFRLRLKGSSSALSSFETVGSVAQVVGGGRRQGLVCRTDVGGAMRLRELVRDTSVDEALGLRRGKAAGAAEILDRFRACASLFLSSLWPHLTTSIVSLLLRRPERRRNQNGPCTSPKSRSRITRVRGLRVRVICDEGTLVGGCGRCIAPAVARVQCGSDRFFEHAVASLIAALSFDLFRKKRDKRALSFCGQPFWSLAFTGARAFRRSSRALPKLSQLLWQRGLTACELFVG